MRSAGGCAFPREARLLNARDYSRVFESPDSKSSHQHMLLLAARNELAYSRVGIIVAKKHVKLAVQRNRFKRITRETFRCLESRQLNLDVIVMARSGVDALDNATLSSILRQQWKKLTR